MESALKAIAEPNRRHILELVADDELTAGDIAEQFEVTRTAISQHLSVLKDAGLISERRDGTRRLYRIRREGFAESKLLLESFWDVRLHRLRESAEAPVAGEVSERVAVHQEVAMAAPAETVWDLLVDPNQIVRWMGVSASVDLSPGGSFRIEVVPGQVAAGEYVVIDPPHRLVYTWGWDSGDAALVVPAGSTLVEIGLIETDSNTLLSLTHRDLPEVGSASSHSRGWGHYLPRLADARRRRTTRHRPLDNRPRNIHRRIEATIKQRTDPRSRQMTTRETITRYFDALQKGDGWDEYLADGIMFTSYTSPIRQITGRESYLASTRGFYRMIGTIEVRDLIVDGDRAFALTRYLLNPPAGEPFTSDVAEVFTVSGDKIDTFDIVFDSAPYPS